MATRLRSNNRLEGKGAHSQYRKSAYFENRDLAGHTYLCLHPYLPTRYQATTAEQTVRSLVFNFKDGLNTAHVADLMAFAILRSFPADELAESILIIVPASTAAKNEKRYKRFCEVVCMRTGLANGYSAIAVRSDREALKGQVSVNKTANLAYNTALIQKKKVLLFDDVMTTGASFKQNAQLLMQHGAQSVTGLFLARTVNR